MGENEPYTAAAVNACPWNFGPDGAGDGRFYRTASGVCVFLTVERGSFKVTMKTVCVDLCVQRTTRFLFGIRRWFRDSSAQQN